MNLFIKYTEDELIELNAVGKPPKEPGDGTEERI